ncbi:hypothetical protein CEXT_213981, partial [Caerostris extrusa]
SLKTPEEVFPGVFHETEPGRGQRKTQFVEPEEPWENNRELPTREKKADEESGLEIKEINAMVSCEKGTAEKPSGSVMASTAVVGVSAERAR